MNKTNQINQIDQKVERDRLPLNLVKTTVRDYLATISRSSISNTNVAPGLIRGGRPLSR